MRAEGNCGNGELGRVVEEPRVGELRTDRVEEIAWHHGRRRESPNRRPGPVSGTAPEGL